MAAARRPAVRSSADINFTQPIFQGGGTRANLAPLVIAQIDTERSFYPFKDSVQQLVTGVIGGYWAVVFARTDVWVRRQQVEQGLEAFGRAEARLEWEMGDLAEVSQARSALATFRANLITSESGLLQREAALRNILGISPCRESMRWPPIAGTVWRVGNRTGRIWSSPIGSWPERLGAARINLDQQWASFERGRTIYLNVLEAITTWADAVSAEAQALAQYNTELANLEQQMGTILETHGVRFQDRVYCSLGPLGRTAADRTYPQGTRPSRNADLYPVTDEPAETVFDLNDPIPARRERIVPPPPTGPRM